MSLCKEDVKNSAEQDSKRVALRCFSREILIYCHRHSEVLLFHWFAVLSGVIISRCGASWLGTFKARRANARNIVGPNMLRAFAHHVVCCCVLLRLVGSCWMKFETGQTSSNNLQQVATTRNNTQHGVQTLGTCWAQQCCVLLANNVASVCTGLYKRKSRIWF